MSPNSNIQNQDRIDMMKTRIGQLKTESVDPQFSAYLDSILSNLENEENTIHKMERHLEQNYQLYLRRNAARLQPPAQDQQFMQQQPQPLPSQQSMQPPQPVPNQPQQPTPSQQPQPVPNQQPMTPQQPAPVQQTMTPQQPAPVQQTMTPQPVPNQQWMPGQQTQPVTDQSWIPQPQSAPAQIPQPISQPSEPVKTSGSKTWEFKFGTFVLGLVGTCFILVALVYLFMQWSSTLQGILFYVLSIAVFVFSELFLSKRIEKFSYFTTGLGISGIYITTILNYLYLKIIPSWVALLITVIVTGFFFWLSRKKDSGMIRIICLLGCYISLVPLGDLENLAAFILPAAIIFALNLAGLIYPIKHGNTVTDYIQYVCTVALSVRMVYLLYISGLQMWPFYIFICCNILTLHILCRKKLDKPVYQLLYCLMHGIFLGFLLYVGVHEDWMVFGVAGLAVLCTGFMFLYRKTTMRYAPYLYTAVYALLAFILDGDSFNLTIVCMILFVINRMLAVFTDKYAIVDAVYTMLAVWGVALGCRTEELQLLGYIFACLILIGAFFANKLKRYHLYLAVSFAWLFLVTESAYPLICSVLICILAACMIGGGFLKKEKAVRIYGLCLLIFISLKLAAYDFKDAESITRVLVFLIVGLVILGVSFLYIYLEKKQEPSNSQTDINPQINESRQDILQTPEEIVSSTNETGE